MIGCLILGVPVGIECYQRNTSIPTTPVYPGSILIESEMSPHSLYGFYGLTYQTEDTPQEVIEFYASHGCDWWSNQGTKTDCDGGHASPFGIFRVEFVPDAPDGAVIFFVDIAWDRCPGDFNHRLIEN
jgi:hypothetical protein